MRDFFSNKTKINRFNSDERSWFWIRDEEHVGPQHVQHTVKHGGGSVMIWDAYIMAFGLGA